jgi:hypothetical protein
MTVSLPLDESFVCRSIVPTVYYSECGNLLPKSTEFADS